MEITPRITLIVEAVTAYWKIENFKYSKTGRVKEIAEKRKKNIKNCKNRKTLCVTPTQK